MSVLRRTPGRPPPVRPATKGPPRHDSESLAAALARAESPVELLRNLAFPPSTFPVQPEFTNWRSEQRSWLETCALLDQSHHMHDCSSRARTRCGCSATSGSTPSPTSARGRPSSSSPSTPTATSSVTPSCSTWTRALRPGRPPHGARLGARSTSSAATTRPPPSATRTPPCAGRGRRSCTATSCRARPPPR